MIVRAIKWGTLLLTIVLIAIVGYCSYLYRQIRDYAARDEARTADAIVVLGAAQYNGHPSPVFKARLDHALDLFRKGYANSIITTGGYGPDPNFSEALVGTQYLVQRGVSPTAIITEQGSGTTSDSISAVSRLMQAKAWTAALVVSDGFHLFRLKRMFENNGIAAFTSPAPNSPIEASSSQRFFYSMREVLLFSVYRIV
jgi:uncharacterized SAM-binding protein YcdF (DUF218 family)